jgi:ribose transport system permease protein
MGRIAWIRTHLRIRASLLLLVGLFALFAVLSGGTTLSGENLHNLAQQIALTAPVVLAQMIALLIGGMDLSVGAVLAMAGVLAVGLQPLGLWPAVIAAVLFGTLIGAVNGILVTRAGVNAFIVTLGTMNLVTGALLTYTHQQPIAGTIPSFTEFGGGDVLFLPTPLLIVLAISAVLYAVMAFTRIGRNLYAVGGNADAAFVTGINVQNYKLLGFIIAGTLSGVAGVLLASSLNSGSVQVGANSSLTSIAAAIIGGASMFGGRGGVGGALIGVTVLGVLANGMNAVGVSTYYQIGVTATILIVVVVFDAVNSRVGGRAALPKLGRWSLRRRSDGVRLARTP